MNKGRIIFLNGVTSSGKTSIVDAIQEKRNILVERPELSPHFARMMDIPGDNPLSIVEVA